MRKVKFVLTLFVAALLASPSLAADLISGYGATPYCVTAESTPLLTIASNADLKDAIVGRMDEAVYVASSLRWIHSSRPAFLWATEAKLACGKAYGYLRSSYRDVENISKCDCFYNRMHHYMN